MAEALFLALAFAASVSGMGFLALAMPPHWEQVSAPRPFPAGKARSVRVLGAVALALSLVLCFVADHPSMAPLVWVMSLAASALVVAFTLVMGASQGVITIVRGAVPLALFGATGYGAVLGVIATPILVVNAASPTVFAWIVDRWGWGAARLSLLVSASAAWLAMELMSRWYERRRAPVVVAAGRAPARSSERPSR